MSIADKLTVIAENEQRVFEAGMSKAESDFWDVVQNFGNRKVYDGAFRLWECEYIRPKYKVIPNSTYGVGRLCYGNISLKKVEKQYFDLSGIRIDFSTNANENMFTGCINLEEVEDLGIPASGYRYTFAECPKLRTIEIVRVAENSSFVDPFKMCYVLTNLTIEGVIGQNGINVSYSTEITHTSLMSIINALKTFTDGTTKTVTLGSTNLAKLTDAEKAIATQKGWTLA